MSSGFSGRDVALLAELERLLANLDVAAYSTAVVETVHALVRGDMVVRWHFDRAGEAVVLRDFNGINAPLGLFEDLQRTMANGMSFLFSTRVPEREQRNRPILIPGGRRVQQIEELSRFGKQEFDAGLRLNFELHERYGLADHHEIRVVFCDGPLALDYINVLQVRAFTRRQRHVFHAASRLLRKRSLLDRRLSDAGAQRATLEAVLDAIGRRAFIIGPGGSILHANALGMAALDRDPAARDEISSALGGSRDAYEVTPVRASGISAISLVVGRRPHLAEIADALATELGLLPRAREVLALVADGYTTKTIASRLGIADNTVEYHLTRIFARVGVTSRAELQRALTDRHRTRE